MDLSNHGLIPNVVVAPPPARSHRRWGVITLVVVAATAGIGLGLGGGRLLAPAPGPPVTTVVRSGPPVIVAVRDLARLETAEYRMERVIDLRDHQQLLMGMVDAEDSILLVASARVSAGVDLRNLDDDDVTVDRDRSRVTIRLPKAEIFDATLDNDRTYVHSRDTDLLAERAESLESRARREAEKTLRKAALEADLLDRAQANAERTVHALMQSLDFDEIVIERR